MATSKKSKPKPLCPGKSQYVRDKRELSDDHFRRLVRARARCLITKEADANTKTQRKKLESQIETNFEKIDREANFLPAAFLTRGATRAGAVCRIVTRTSLGTGFLVAPGVLMTNNHVLRTEDTARGSVAEFDFEEGKIPRSVSVDPDRLFITHRELDFTIVACDQDSTSEVEPIQLLRNPQTVTRNEAVNIIQHPAGRRKEIAIHENQVTRIRNKIIKYQTDTEPGSSGSPVFNNDWELVALHHAGEQLPGGRAENEGIRMAAIVAHLLRLQRESTSPNEALSSVVNSVTDSSPLLGFFDTHGVGDGLEVEVPDFAGTPDFADIGFWNIEHFNNQISTQRVRDVADVVERLAMDAMGLVEVQQEALERLRDELRSRGKSADFRLLNVGGSQDLAVFFDPDTTEVELNTDHPQEFRQQIRARTAAGKTAFPRPPLFADCVVKDGNDNDVKFTMIVVHLKAFGDAESRNRRRLASEKLAEMVAALHAKGKMVVLGGDFNDRFDTDVFDDLTDAPDLLAMTSDDATDGAISFVGPSHRSLIDHIVVSADAQLGSIQGDDTAIVRLDQSVADFADRVSDHVPLVFRMVMRADPVVIDDTDDDDTALVVPIPEGALGVELGFVA